MAQSEEYNRVQCLPGLEKLVKHYKRVNRDRAKCRMKVCGVSLVFELSWDNGLDVTVAPVSIEHYGKDYSSTFWKKYITHQTAITYGEDTLAAAISKFSIEIQELERAFKSFAKQHKVDVSMLFDVVMDDALRD